LKRENLMPRIRTIEVVPAADANRREAYYIQEAIKKGEPLFNKVLGRGEKPKAVNPGQRIRNITLPTQLYERIEDIAYIERRNVNQQIVYWLTRCVEIYEKGA
jgi:hypothetical protein